MNVLPFARVGQFVFVALAAGLAIHTGAFPGYAQDRSALGGSWSGGGVIVTPSGNRERASCRATFRNQGASSYTMNAVCATASARVQQTAEIQRAGGNTFTGSFYNAEYGVAGSIVLRLNAGRLSASLDGGGASAHFTLRR